MAELDILEGTWDELAVHADALRGKRLRLTIISNTTPVDEANEAVQPRNLAEFLGDFIGSVEGNGENNSEDTGEKFTQYLVKKHAEGHL
jgi:hypothetical protein